MMVINTFEIDKKKFISFDNTSENTAAMKYLKSYLRLILDSIY